MGRLLIVRNLFTFLSIGFFFCAPDVSAGKLFSRPHSPLQSQAVPLVNPIQPYRDDMVFFDATQLQLARYAILESPRNESEKIRELVKIYEKGSHFFETPDDFINLLSYAAGSNKNDERIYQKAAEKFLMPNLQTFFDLKPTIVQIANLSNSVVWSRKSSIAIKKDGLPFVKSPREFLLLIRFDEASDDFNREILELVKTNLTFYTSLQPVVDDGIELYRYLHKITPQQIEPVRALGTMLRKEFPSYASLNSIIFHNVRKTIHKSKNSEDEKVLALSTLFEDSIDLFLTPADYVQNLKAANLKGSVVTVTRRAASEFLKTHIRDFFSLIPTVKEIAELADYTSHLTSEGMAIKQEGMKYVKSPTDFLELVRHRIKEAAKGKRFRPYEEATTNLIRHNLEIFKATTPHPTIDDVIDLHKYLFSIQTDDREITIATVIELKEAFIDYFHGAKRIRLLDSVCEHPTTQYQRQLEKLEKMYSL